MVIAASQVERWVQPDLVTLRTDGESFVDISSDAVAVAAVEGEAGLLFTSGSSTGAWSLGAARLAFDADGSPAPLCVAAAVVGFEGDAPTDEATLVSAIALARIGSSASVTIVGFGEALLSPIGLSPVEIPVVGDAEISFGDFGLDVPILPMTFPFAFSEASLLPRADAVLVFDGAGEVSVGVSAPADLRFRGDTGLSFEGSNPVFPFEFPTVFDSDAVVRLAGAVADLGGQPFPLAPVFDETAVAGIVAECEVLSSAFLPFRFPAYFVPSAATVASAKLAFDGSGDVVVGVNSYATVPVLAFSVIPVSEFPLVFPFVMSNGGTGFPLVLPIIV